MSRSLLRLTTFLCLLLTGTGLLSGTVQAQTLVIAQVSDRPKKDFKQLRPMAQHIAAQLAEFGFDRAEVQLYRSADDLIAAARSGQVHWISETPYTAARLVREANCRALAQKWKNGQPRYQTLIYTRSDAPIHTLSDLVGQRIAFEHPDSFSSYYLPRRLLEQAGLTLSALEHASDPVPPGTVGYLFSRNEKNNALWVDKGLVAAGALNDGDWEADTRVPTAIRARLRVLHRSDYYPRAFELVTPAMPAAAAEKMQQLLLAMNSTSHPALLARYENTEAFATVSDDDRRFLSSLTALDDTAHTAASGEAAQR
jgi:phosphonate transport system substrate-binding protein